MATLRAVLANTQKPRQPLLLLQSSSVQSGLPILREILKNEIKKCTVLLICVLYAPSVLLHEGGAAATREGYKILDWMSCIPGFCENEDVQSLESRIVEVENILKTESFGPATIVIDSIETLTEDLGSESLAYKLLSFLLSEISRRPAPSRLILHSQIPSSITPFLLDVTISPTLTHIMTYPPVLLTHIATEFLTPPPPLSTPEKFWQVFLPISGRHEDVEGLVTGQNGEGTGGFGSNDCVIEIVVRGGGLESSGMRRKLVERHLEGWISSACEACELSALPSLKHLWSKKTAVAVDAEADPIKDLSFNLNLTPTQQASRAQVPLPYAHQGKPLDRPAAPPAIYYDPDSGDDIDDEDPDEDLDI